MTLLDDAPRASGSRRLDVHPVQRLPWRDWGASLVAGVLAAVALWAIVLLPVLAGWLADPGSDVGFTDTTSMSASIWAAGHRGPLDAGTHTVVLAPLLLLGLAVLCCRYAASHVLRHRHTVPEGGVTTTREALTALGVDLLGLLVLGYLAIGVALALLAGSGPAPVSLPSLLPGLLLTPIAGAAWAGWREHRYSPNPAFDRGVAWLEAHVPVFVQRSWRPAAQALAGLLAASTLIVLALLALQHERVLALYGILDAGPVGIGVLTLAQLALLPNLSVWTLGWVAGAPLSVGSVQIGWVGTVAGELPVIPVLGAVPEPGPLPAWTWVVVLLPIAAGAWIGCRVALALPRLCGWVTKVLTSGAACLAVALAVLALTWLASGSLTPGTMDHLGTPPLESAGLLLAELLGGALVAALLTHVVRARRL